MTARGTRPLQARNRQQPGLSRALWWGRAADCRALEGPVQAVSRGLSRSLVIVGEPGIGKTRLLEYAAQRRRRRAGGAALPGWSRSCGWASPRLHRMLVPYSWTGSALLPAPQREAL